jgi:hypothetical protein
MRAAAFLSPRHSWSDAHIFVSFRSLQGASADRRTRRISRAVMVAPSSRTVSETSTCRQDACLSTINQEITMRKALTVSLTLISLGAVIDTAAAKPRVIDRYVMTKAQIQRLCPNVGGSYILDDAGAYSCNIPAIDGLPTVAIDCSANGSCTETLGASRSAKAQRS